MQYLPAALVLVTEWKTYVEADLARVRAAMRHTILLDGRNVFDPARVIALGFEYHGVGRGALVTGHDGVVRGSGKRR